jgi:hypothetical protein
MARIWLQQRRATVSYERQLNHCVMLMAQKCYNEAARASICPYEHTHTLKQVTDIQKNSRLKYHLLQSKVFRGST